MLNKGEFSEVEKVDCKIPTQCCQSAAPFAAKAGNRGERKKLQLKVQQQKVSN